MTVSYQVARQLFMVVPDPLLVVDSSGVTKLANTPAEELLGIFPGANVADFADDADGLFRFLARCRLSSLALPARIMFKEQVDCIVTATLLLVPGTDLDRHIVLRLDQKLTIASKFAALDAQLSEMNGKVKMALAEKRQFEHTAIRDPLTHVFNRRGFDDRFATEYKRATRYSRPLSIAILDLDHFKGINDTHGHAIGDQVIRHFANICQASIREQDTFARIGGEEFALVMPETMLSDAAIVIGRIVRSAARTGIQIDDKHVSYTVSAGLSQLNTKETREAFLARADANLYAAKSGGRNRYIADAAVAA